jgi:hypothetical protein
MIEHILFAGETGVGGPLVTFLASIVGGLVTIATALIRARVQLQTARIQTGKTGPVASGPPSQDPGSVPSSPTPKADLRKSRVAMAVLIVCGAILIGWGVYGIVTIHQLNSKIAEKEKEITDKEKETSEVKEQFRRLNESFPQAAGVIFNPVSVKSEYRPDGNTRLYHLWIEADRKVLEQINHVKYIMNDPSWRAGKDVFTPDDPNLSGRKHFLLEIKSYEALTYITVLVMYKGYKNNGHIQPVNFRWRDESRPAE